MQDYQHRVIREKQELEERLTKLRVFIGSNAFGGLDGEEQALLLEQAFHMGGYLLVLKRRLKLWGIE